MNLGEALDRCYDILGDLRNDPQIFQRAELVELINRGCMVFRRFVEERWFRTTQEITVSVAEYTFPEGSMRPVRIAFEDWTLPPASVQELQGFDSLWQTRTGEPRRWTSDINSYDKYRLFPIPNASTADTIEFIGDPAQTHAASWSNSRGKVARWTVDGANVTFVADPNVVGWSKTRGRVARADSIPFSSNTGRVAEVGSAGVGKLDLWCVEIPATLSGDAEEIPLKNAYQVAVVYFALSHIYEQEGEFHNSVLSAYFDDLFKDLVERARERMSSPFPFQVHRFGQGTYEPDAAMLPFPSSATIDGSTVNFGWPKRGYY